MNTFEYFYKHQHLPNHDSNNFNDQIKCTLTDILLHDLVITNDYKYMFKNWDLSIPGDDKCTSSNNKRNVIRCMTCLENVNRYNADFIICDKCCREISDMSFYIMISWKIEISPDISPDLSLRVYGCRDIYHAKSESISNNFGVYSQNIYLKNGKNLDKTYSSIFEQVINNSHNLHRRYLITNVTPIIFILSISDVNSLCHTLNVDLIFQVLRFIY